MALDMGGLCKQGAAQTGVDTAQSLSLVLFALRMSSLVVTCWRDSVREHAVYCGSAAGTDTHVSSQVLLFRARAPREQLHFPEHELSSGRLGQSLLRNERYKQAYIVGVCCWT